MEAGRLLPPKEEVMVAQGWQQWTWREGHRLQMYVERVPTRLTEGLGVQGKTQKGNRMTK